MDIDDTGSNTLLKSEPAHDGCPVGDRALRLSAPSFIDLSTDINPVAYPLPRLPDAAFIRPPDPEEEASLRWEAAAAYGAAHASMVIAAPGIDLLAALLPRLFPARCAIVLQPSCAGHAAAWREAGAALHPARDFTEAMTEAMHDDGPDAAALCNPGNPDGVRHPPEALLALADRLHRRSGLLVVDESHADLEPDMRSLAPRLPHPAIVVLRSVDRAHGLGGLRLGFALAAPERIARIRVGLGPSPVSGAAIAIGRQVLADRAWRAAAAARLRQDAGLLDQMLHGAGLRARGGTRLFRLGEGAAAPTLRERLERAGILTGRVFDRPDWLRLGIPGSDADWRRLRAALGADPFCGAFTRRAADG